MDTIFALSSGAPPAAIAVLRISGPRSADALEALAGRVPEPRVATYARLRDAQGETLDRGLVLWFPGPASATGEDTAELHLHGGRGVVAAVEKALSQMPELRRATPGEFTRRAFANGRIDLAEAEGLADLLEAETELQRRAALAMAGGHLSRIAADWRERTLALSASVESALDFSDEDDVSSMPPSFQQDCVALASEMEEWLDRPGAEKLKEGFRIAIAGPPNAGKSSLFNRLVNENAAITSSRAGTTRDILSAPVAIEGIPVVFVDTAGLRSQTDDEIEAEGIARAERALAGADLVLWLGAEGEGPDGAWEIAAQCDRLGSEAKAAPRHRLSALTGEGIDALADDLIEYARAALPKPGQVALNQRQRELLRDATESLRQAGGEGDLLLAAESLRRARQAFDRLLGRATTEDMLDALFGRFCIGK